MKKKIKLNSKKTYFSLLFLFLLFAIVNWYNACGLDKSFYSRSSISNSSNKEETSILINNGAAATNNSEVQIQLEYTFNTSSSNQKGNQKPSAHEVENYEMKISDDEDCMGGQWEPFISEKSWTIPEYKEGTNAFIFVNFKSNTLQKISDCFSNSIFYDSKAPEIKMNLNQPEVTNKTKVDFIFSGFDSSPFQFQCQIKEKEETENNEWTDCINRKTYENLDTGKIYTFQLKATDDLGNSTQLTRSISIDQSLALNDVILDIDSLPDPITNDIRAIEFSFSKENNPTTIICSAGLEDDPSTHQVEPCDTTFLYTPLEGINFFKIEWNRDDASTGRRVEISYQWIVDISL